jgi:hypothetical protein
MRHRDASARSAGTQSGIPARHTKSVGRRVPASANRRNSASPTGPRRVPPTL